MSAPAPERAPQPAPDAGGARAPAGRGPRIAALLVLFALPLALRLVAIDHGGARNYLPDTHVVRSALGMARDRDPVPPVGRYSTYPNLVPYMLLPVYAAQYAVGRATGRWAGAGEFAHHALESPEDVHLPARILVAVLGALTAWVTYRTARAAGLRAGAWVAAWLVATGLLHVQLSMQERPWVPMTFFLALSAWPAVRYVSSGRTRDLALAALAGAGAFACHQAGLPALGIAGLAWAFGPRGWRGGEVRARLAQGGAAVAVFAVASLAVGHPYLLVHGATSESEIAGIGSEDVAEETKEGLRLSVGGQAVVLDLRAASLARLSRAFFGYEPVLCVLGLLGIAGALRDRRLRVPTAFALLWGAFFLTNRNDHVRYLLPIAVLLPLAAGRFAERVLARPRRVPVLAVLLAIPLAQAARLTWLLGREDTRAIGERFVEALPEGSRVAIDRYGPLVPYDRASLERLAATRPLASREAHRLEMLEAGAETRDGAGRWVMRIEDHVGFDDRRDLFWRRDEERPDEEGFDAERARERLRSSMLAEGVTHLLLVDRTPGEPRRSSLAGLVSEDALVAVVDPGGGEPPEQCRLPMEMELALRDLWEVERPGPWLGLYRLRP